MSQYYMLVLAADLTLSSFSNVLKSMLIRDSFSFSLLSFSFSPIISVLNESDVLSLPIRPSVRPLLHFTLTSTLFVLLILSVLSVRVNFLCVGDTVPKRNIKKNWIKVNEKGSN